MEKCVTHHIWYFYNSNQYIDCTDYHMHFGASIPVDPFTIFPLTGFCSVIYLVFDQAILCFIKFKIVLHVTKMSQISIKPILPTSCSNLVIQWYWVRGLAFSRKSWPQMIQRAQTIYFGTVSVSHVQEVASVTPRGTAPRTNVDLFCTGVVPLWGTAHLPYSNPLWVHGHWHS